MSFAVNMKEPLESEIPQKFDPAYGDKNRHKTFKFNTPNHKFQKFVLEENGYYIEGRTNGILLKGL